MSARPLNEIACCPDGCCYNHAPGVCSAAKTEGPDNLRLLCGMPAPDRLALARALVADMPGVVVAKVPDAIRYTAISIDAPTNPPSWIAGFNAAISAIITAGSATDVG